VYSGKNLQKSTNESKQNNFASHNLRFFFGDLNFWVEANFNEAKERAKRFLPEDWDFLLKKD